MGALGGLVLAAIYRELTWTKVKESVFLTAKATAMVCWLFVGHGLLRPSSYLVERHHRTLGSCAKP